MSQGTPLDRLSSLAGIAADYEDALGQRHPLAPATKRALLEAMGWPAGDDAQVADSLAGLLENEWSRLVDPVQVLTVGEPASIPVRLPASDTSSGPLAWEIGLEDGSRLNGSQDPDGLAEIDRAEIDGRIYLSRKLPLPDGLPLGYHDLTAECGGEYGACRIIVAPWQCADVATALDGGRGWGAAMQLYSIRSRGNWGVGDFSDLGRVVTEMAAMGADVVGLNPLHALFPADPHHFGPYSPSSRGYLNVLYIDVEALEDFPSSPRAREMLNRADVAEALATARNAELVDYPATAAAKLPVLEQIFEDFRAQHLGATPTPRGEAFLEHLALHPGLERHATFEALHEHFFGSDAEKWAWQSWPEAYRQCESPEVRSFAKANRHRIEFFAYLQWVAWSQLAAAQSSASEAGMRVGLFKDLAVAVHPSGSTTWAYPETVASGISIGAPADEFNRLGQNWGLAAFCPHGLRAAAYEPFIAALRANMRSGGAVRIDHVMALTRLFWIPEGGDARDGGYVHYPFEDLLRIVALESRRNDCLVIGEALGTVPPGFRERLADAGILSYRLLWFERDEKTGGYARPENYPEAALVAVSTHDLPTLAGYWLGRDIDWREDIGTLTADLAAKEREIDRPGARRELIRLLVAEGLLEPDESSPDLERLTEALHAAVARTPSRLMLTQIEDMLGALEQVNLPGTVHEHPNWRRRLTVDLSELFTHPLVQAVARAIAVQSRGRR